ncbi:MAG: hypothetical protein KC897_01515 [Candidatus Omnitrophica bacterium]|nr:hypothetical protein [Candidatus Omnitrophota bacterium]
MPFSFFLCLYEHFQKKHAEDFDQKNKILSPEDIRGLLRSADRARALRVLRSAVVDHHPVDGVPYHLRYPVNELFYHDRFKRAVIAAGIGRELAPADKRELEDALAILYTMTDPGHNAGFVVLLAWDALGRLNAAEPAVTERFAPDLQRALAGPVGSAIGALVYCDHARSAGMTKAVMPILLNAAGKVRFRLQKVLLRYYLEQFPAVTAGPAIATLSTGPGIGRFVREVRDGRSWSQADITEGLVQIDLFGANQERAFWDNTPHAEVGRLVTAAAQEYLRICGAYTNGVRT